MSSASFQEFKVLVLNDAALQRSFREVADDDTFVRTVLASAQERGFEVTQQDLAEEMLRNRRVWIEKWLYQ